MKLLNLPKVLKSTEEFHDKIKMTKESQESIKKAHAFYGSVPDPSLVKCEKSDDLKPKKTKYTSIQWLTLITLAFGNFCAGACVSLQAPFFPSEAEQKGATPTEYGFIFGIFQLTIFVTAPLFGKLVCYISPKFILNSGILTVGVTCILFGTLDLIRDTTTFVALAFVIRTVEGMGAAALRTSCYTIIASQFTEGIGTTFSVLEMFLGLGLITGPTLGGALYDLGGYELPFYVVGSIVFVDAVIIFFILPDVERTVIVERGNLLKFWMSPGILIYSLSVFTAFNYIGFNQAALEPHIRTFDLSGLFLGMLFALAGTVYAMSAPLWGWICDKWGNFHVLSLFGCSLTIVSLFLIGPAPFINVEPNLYFIIISLVIFGFGLGAKLVCAFTGSLQTTVNMGMPPGLATYGLVSSMIASSQSLGAFVGPSLGGFLLDQFGYRNASMMILGLESTLVILLMFYICLVKNKRTIKISNQNRAISTVCQGVKICQKTETGVYQTENGTNKNIY
ncbi:MFS-type transporter SLC18B1 isoform X2 [Parasteatoda tepidariorum]|uniref:MFS-type transporter SLC18B1 isoform X2 n=1 Tax=Parasteatoda tepidariorum TaxID=114398 RepID=UPI00077FC9A6|nr:MFS-type transporter SLC18B1 isoform X2 [Parasteatoda tepidariorum]